MKLPLKILIHFIFWSVFLMFTTFMSLTGSRIGDLPAISNILPHFIVNCVWAATIFYLFYGFFIKYFENKQFVRYLLYAIVSSIGVSFIYLGLHKCINHQFNIINYRVFGPPIIGTFILAQCGCLVRGFENWFTNIQLKTELENRNLKYELELLKSQINPHFLFNTLNNIDSFIQTSPEEASRSLIALSNMLRYMIYDTKSSHTPLNKEIEYINNFIELQHIRYPDPDSLSISLPQDCTGIQVAPMLFIPFIENAFKYSVSSGKMPIINISITCNEQILEFNCRNYYKNDGIETGKPGGVGLENVKRRLELLYPNRHKLTISKEDYIYNVNLIIHLL